MRETHKILNAIARAAASASSPEQTRTLLEGRDLIEQLKRERDSARRMYCLAAAQIDGNEYQVQVYAARQGWGDLFPND